MTFARLRSSPNNILVALVFLALITAIVAGCAGPVGTAGDDMPASRSGLPAIRYQDLPQQARDTIALIEQDGPFPFQRDGITFQNRERLLPSKPSGYYREYTVITPGSRDRGARRIVAGAEGELYYTDDHYDSFKEVVR